MGAESPRKRVDEIKLLLGVPRESSGPHLHIAVTAGKQDESLTSVRAEW